MRLHTMVSLVAVVASISLCGAVTLVEQGQPKSVIVVAPAAPDSVHYAAKELQEYLRQVSGVTVPIQTTVAVPGGTVIYVGESDSTRKLGLTLDGLTSDGFKIVSGNTWVAIFGRDYAGPPIAAWRNPWRYHEVYNKQLKLGAFGEAGTLYGVYRFLEDVCGVRWYMPGPLGTVVPKKATISTGTLDLRVSPAFEYRYPWLCNFAQSAADAVWYRRAGFGAAYPAQIIDSFGLFTAKYAKTHPEYFALIGGKRDFANLSTIVGPGNLCLSNPAVARQWAADISAYFDQNPNQFIFPLSPNDGMKKICECQACQAQIDPALGDSGKFSNYVWTFIDTVARDVAVKHPDKWVGGIAYESYNFPPTRLKTLAPNVAVMICKMRATFADPKEEARMRASIASWNEKTKTLYFWEYYLHSWLPWRNFPVFFPHLIARDLQHLRGIGKGEFIEAESSVGGKSGTLECPGMAHLNLYFTARLLWNPNLDLDAALADYYAKFYGPAQPPMQEFWTTAEKIWMDKSPRGDPVNVYTKAEMDRLSGCLDQAVAKTVPGSVYRQRVELIQAEFLPAKRKLANVLVVNPPKLVFAGPVPAPQLDGRLEDSAWQGFEPFGFVDNDGEAAEFKTWGYAAWDDENLYLAFANYDPAMNQLAAKATRRDQHYGPGMWDDDSMEIFICPDPANRKKYYQFIINAKGQIWDARAEADKAMTPEVQWNSYTQAAARLEPNRWVVEVRIPLRDLGISAPVAGKSIAVNFFRNRHCGQPVVYSCWSPTLNIQHAIPARFGLMEFKKKIDQ